ncbi:MAG: GGDEF domain-containing protein, partial [Lachnospiraceae bacterium]|nr:GGDEF domain-containing protein [Lachnospiraceae bacterium]
MDDLRGQIELLSSVNRKLMKDVKMLHLICETSNSAFLYYNYEEDTVQTIANWDYFFDFQVKSREDFSRFYDCVEEKYVTPLREALFIEKRGMKSTAIDVKMKDGRMWVEVEITIVYDEEGHPTDKIIRFKDVTKFNSQNDELTYMAYYDLLTGLYNRNYFVRLLGEFVRRAKEEERKVAVMFIDLDDFRRMSDELGIIIGDEIVQTFGQFLAELGDENIVISHFNGDIFCIGVYHPYGDRSVESVYARISERLQRPFRLSSGQEIFLTISVGIAEYKEEAVDTLDLLNCAEIVMFRSKE